MTKYILLIVSSVFIFSCTSRKEIQIGSVKFMVPENWVENRPESTNVFIETLSVSNDNEIVVVVYSSEQLNSDGMMYYFEAFSEHSTDKVLHGVDVDSVRNVTFQGQPARQADLSNSVDGLNLEGTLIMPISEKQSIWIITLHKVGTTSNEEEILNSFHILPALPPSKQQLEEKMHQFTSSINKNLPQPVDEITIYDKVEVSGSTLKHIYSITQDFTDQDIDILRSELRDSQIQILLDVNSSLVSEWLGRGNKITYIFNDTYGNELFHYTITEKDLR